MSVTLEDRKFLGSLWKLEGRIREACSVAIELAVKDATKTAKETTLWKDKSGYAAKNKLWSITGTRASIKGTANKFSGNVIAKGAAYWLENGTPPHRIAARSAQYLRFVSNGETFLRKSVWHPGTKPRPFMYIAELEGKRTLEYMLDHHLNLAISSFNSKLA